MLTDKAREDIVIGLVGNKLDLEAKRAVTKAQGEEKAKAYGAIFLEVSAKTGENVKEIFKDLTKHLTNDEYQQQEHMGHGHDADIQLDHKNAVDPTLPQKKKKCC